MGSGISVKGIIETNLRGRFFYHPILKRRCRFSHIVEDWLVFIDVDTDGGIVKVKLRDLDRMTEV